MVHLTSDEGKADLKGLGGLSASTAGVLLLCLALVVGGGWAAWRFVDESEVLVRERCTAVVASATARSARRGTAPARSRPSATCRVSRRRRRPRSAASC